MSFSSSSATPGPLQLRFEPAPWSASPGAWLRSRVAPTHLCVEPARLVLGKTLENELVFLNSGEMERHLTVFCENEERSRAYLEDLVAQHVLSGGACLYLDYSEYPTSRMRKISAQLTESYKAFDSAPVAQGIPRLLHTVGQGLWHIRGLCARSWMPERLEQAWLSFLPSVLERLGQAAPSRPFMIAASASTAANDRALRALLPLAPHGLAVLRARKPGHEFFDGSHAAVFLGELRDLRQFWPSRTFQGKDPHLGAWWASQADPALTAMSPAVLRA